MGEVKQFFWFAREREMIRRLRESGLSPPFLTEDEVLRNYRFCNVFREDDKVTVWFRKNLRDKVQGDPVRSLMACTAFRWFNTVDAGEVLAPIVIEHGWDDRLVRFRLQQAQDLGAKLFTGAYMLKSPRGFDKITGLCDCILKVWEAREWFHDYWLDQANIPLETFHRKMMRFPYLGRFMAYEVITDLRHTCVLNDAPDILTWASAGPGAARGLGWMQEDDPDAFNYASDSQQQAMLGHMRTLLALSRHSQNWPQEWGRWELREVEHTLCEYDKWRRGKAGQRLKRRFTP